MHQAGDRDAQHLLVRHLQLGLLALELARPLARKVADAERVLVRARARAGVRVRVKARVG
jgi:hypothetical protein